MIQTKSIKIWTLLTHAFIIIGMGHGILTLGILEAFSLATLFDKPEPADGGDVSSMALRLVGLFSLIGQVAIIASIFVKVKTTGIILQLSGLFFLWSSLLTYAYSIRNDHYSYLAVWTYLPFLYFTIRTLAGRRMSRLWHRAIEKI